ncbi:hypothetical protein E6W39_18130 [Kitasatospora acidiphila]|uniref:Uncharacterized protein n=1 Tax=Kitasatospora acidiphila TaxID=2567942 RepID=A0A540W609_9ACTN|nr:hypothetical protein [Kitasatospora acidiphila]TQF03794.1 hypothetical protein E6W39_18130 [Kitasatospora acidiphila]
MTTDQLRATVPPAAPRWAVRAAHATALLTVPSGVWRLLLAIGHPAGYTAAGYHALIPDGWAASYVIVLSVGSELLALLTLGLVRPWGEVLPRWLPRFGGRAVHPRTATVTAALGALALTAVWTPFAFWWLVPHHDMTPLGHTLVGFVYLPLAFWGPLVGLLTLAYHRRRAAVA